MSDTLPEAAQKFQEAARKEFEGPGKALERMQRAADELERATVEAGRAPARRHARADRAAEAQYPPVPRDHRERRPAAIGAALIVLFLAYFLLASGDAFRRKWVALSGPTLAKRVTVQVMDEIRARSSATSACRC